MYVVPKGDLFGVEMQLEAHLPLNYHLVFLVFYFWLTLSLVLVLPPSPLATSSSSCPAAGGSIFVGRVTWRIPKPIFAAVRAGARPQEGQKIISGVLIIWVG